MSANTSDQQTPDKQGGAAGVRKWLVSEIAGVVFVGATLFIPAWRLNWAMGWALVGIYAAWVGVNAILLIPTSPELLIERAARRKDTKRLSAEADSRLVGKA